MTDLPEPLTPPECDLRDFAFMPLECMRLRRSKAWLTAKKNPALGFYMVNLWTVAWHELPAASLEDDDDVLADAAMCDPKVWPKVKEQAMRGWVKCSDGRLYHPVVAEKARDAWERKQAQRQRTEAARQARTHRRNSGSDSNVTSSVTENATKVVTASKGQGQGQGEREREETPNPSSLRDEGDNDYLQVGEETNEGRPPGWKGQWRGLRANGTNPRAQRQAPRDQAEVVKPPTPEPDSPLWPLLRARGMSPVEWRATLGRCSLDDDARRVLAPSAFVAASIRSEHGHALEAEGWRVEASS